MFNNKTQLFFIKVIIIGSVFSDLLYGFFNIFLQVSFPIGAMFRIIVLLFTVFYFITIKVNRIYSLYLFVLVILWLSLNILWALSSSRYSISIEFSAFLKILYPLLIAAYLSHCLRKGIVSMKGLVCLVVQNAIIAGIFIIFSYITGIGLNTYGGKLGYGFGTTSFFKAQNDLSLSLLIGLCFSYYSFLEYRNGRSFLKCIVILSALMLVGTRAGLLGGIMISIIFMTYLVLGRSKPGTKKTTKFLYTFIFTIGLISIGLYVYNRIITNEYMLTKYEDFSVGSARGVLKDAANIYIKNETTTQKLLGAGTQQYLFGLIGNLTITDKLNAQLDTGKSAEMDFLDLRGAYGAIFSLFVFLFPTIVLFYYSRIFLLIRNSLYGFSFLMCILIFLGHSLYAGHAIMNPMVGTIISVVYAGFLSNYIQLHIKQKKIKKNKLF